MRGQVTGQRVATCSEHLRVSPVGGPPTLALVALDGGLKLCRVREVLLQALKRVQILGVPGKEGVISVNRTSKTLNTLIFDK